MDEETLMLLSMKDSKAVADALSNKTAQKILSYIAENKEATESELAEKLSTPLPTIHYNIEQLKKANLLKSKEFYWSKKGKKMRVFTLAKKYIIISPEKSSKSALKKLKDLLPATIISFIGAAGIYTYQKSISSVNELPLKDTAEAMLAQEAVTRTATTEPNLALWFLIGSIFTILLVFLFSMIKKK